MCFTECTEEPCSVCFREYRSRSRSRSRHGHSGGSSSSPIRPPPRCYSPRHRRRPAAAPAAPSYTTVRRSRSRCQTIEESLIPIRAERPRPAWVDVRCAYRCIPARATAVECVEIVEPEACLVVGGWGRCGPVWEVEVERERECEVEVEYIPARC